MGHWLRSNSEFCIMAVKGKPKLLRHDQATVIYGPMREHSRKPEQFYEMVETLCIAVGWTTSRGSRALAGSSSAMNQGSSLVNRGEA